MWPRAPRTQQAHTPSGCSQSLPAFPPHGGCARASHNPNSGSVDLSSPPRPAEYPLCRLYDFAEVPPLFIHGIGVILSNSYHF